MDGIYFSEFRDEYWGEPGEYDLYAEVYVGRACVDDEKDVNNFVSKTIDYISTNRNESYLKEVLMAGEGLGWQYSGGDYLDQLIDGSSKNGYKTVGIPSSKYKITKLYDRNRVWPVSELINRINNNVHIINHDGHSGYNNNMKMQISDVDSLTNSKYCFIYSLGCHAGSFDRDDCIAEHLTVKTGHGAFAGIWNAGYGLGNSSSTDGASQRFIREFWDAVFGENIYSIGKANHDSKEDNNYLIDNEDMKYVYFGLNLFGDPSISFIMPKDKGKTKNVLSNEKPIFFRFIKQILILEQLFLKHPFLKTIVERLT